MSNTTNAPQPFYLCSGFHRSGTSMIAQCLAKGGMHMGNELMGASFSNPLGHLEDMPAVRLHDKLFEINGTNWQYCDDSPLIKPNWLQNYLKRYIQARNQSGGIQGVKDPRALYFLKDWQVAGQQSIRYIFIYRHWASAGQSLLNRASRHLVNSVAPIAANRLNYRFWQEPELAFQMWLSSNKRMLDFYAAHQDKCVLIAQEGFAKGQFDAQPLADKLALPVQCLTPSEFKTELMTSKVDPAALALISAELREQLEHVWARLQSLADVSAPEMRSLSSNHTSTGRAETAIAKADKAARPAFQLEGLNWAELLGFLPRIPERLLEQDVFNSAFGRPFGSVEQYLSLAKVTHRAGFYALTKLAKLRAMHVQAGHWRIKEWSLFADECDAWFEQDDQSMAQLIPFSLRPMHERQQGTLPLIDALPDIDEQTLLTRMAKLAIPAARKAIEATLLYKALTTPAQYQQLSQLALRVRAYTLAEFAIIKALRLHYHVDYLVGLGDIYHQQKLLVKAFQVYEEANSLSPQQVAIQVRLAQVCSALGDIDRFNVYRERAIQLAPEHPLVKKWMSDEYSAVGEKKADNLYADMISMLSYEAQSYEDIVKISQMDESEGLTLDLHNLRVSFLLRDNQAWLEEASLGLSVAATAHLRSSIYRQWKKLWPTPLLNSYLGLEVEDVSFTQNDLAKSSETLPRIALYIDTSDPIRLQALLSLVDCRQALFDLYILTTSDNQTEIERLCADWPGKTHIWSASPEVSEPQEWLAFCLQHEANYPAIVKLHTHTNAPSGQICNRLLGQWYGLLGTDETVQKALRLFGQHAQAALLVPPYLPEDAAELRQNAWFTSYQQKCVSLGLPMPSDLVVVPTERMFWYAPTALARLELDKALALNEDFYKLLPSVLEHVGYKTQSIHLL
ncbi:hypothetical protein [Bowmanella yangjiangensis]|uniref:Uncharacterized protein n=1 Tax=Bowmanella yangjiangensis TaxID=2811230 RepID=A0ABS3CTK7_9ALTE|nr:hypothetical protein [Bowmanella yangjiangensis]MBN7820446.1 hypothetical protein [Bowmanella yangjiangensis]